MLNSRRDEVHRSMGRLFHVAGLKDCVCRYREKSAIDVKPWLRMMSIMLTILHL